MHWPFLHCLVELPEHTGKRDLLEKVFSERADTREESLFWGLLVGQFFTKVLPPEERYIRKFQTFLEGLQKMKNPQKNDN